jgi:hypothetical protein
MAGATIFAGHFRTMPCGPSTGVVIGSLTDDAWTSRLTWPRRRVAGSPPISREVSQRRDYVSLEHSALGITCADINYYSQSIQKSHGAYRSSPILLHGLLLSLCGQMSYRGYPNPAVQRTVRMASAT